MKNIKLGEIALIKEISSIPPTFHKDLLCGIGDDTAVIKSHSNLLTLATTDIIVENIHFKKKWSSARQIGEKAVETNVSDIAAMGGKPTFMLISLVILPTTDTLWIKKLYEGIKISCERHGVVLAGGDTSRGDTCIVNVAMLGNVSPENLCLRKHAKIGDLLAVTGHLGNAAAGLKGLSSGYPISKYLLKKHLEPKCKLATALRINSIINAMTDISDGISSEIQHICTESGTGAKIYEASIPIHDEVKSIARHNGLEDSHFALTGGEDLELLFSISRINLESLNKTGVPFYIIGEITDKTKNITLIDKNGAEKEIGSGYDHFI